MTPEIRATLVIVEKNAKRNQLPKWRKFVQFGHPAPFVHVVMHSSTVNEAFSRTLKNGH
jgi:hypothetical protein